jgi:hypothetical protein
VTHNGRPTVPEALPLTRAIYRRSSVGCCLHIVLDDGNVETAHVASCLDYARENGHADCIAAAEALLRMTVTQRRKIIRLTHFPA